MDARRCLTVFYAAVVPVVFGAVLSAAVRTAPVRTVGSGGVRAPSGGEVAGGVTRYEIRPVYSKIRRRDYGVLGSKWGAIPGVLDDEVEIHIVIGGIKRK